MGGDGREQPLSCNTRSAALLPLLLFLFHFLSNFFSFVHEQICIFAAAIAVRKGRDVSHPRHEMVLGKFQVTSSVWFHPPCRAAELKLQLSSPIQPKPPIFFHLLMVPVILNTSGERVVFVVRFS